MSLEGYSLYTASLIGGSTITVNQLDGQDIGPDVQLQRYIAPGTVTGAVNVVMGGMPRIALRSKDVAKILTGISATVGFPCTSGAVFRFQQRAPNGTFKSSTSHVTLTSSLGWAVPTGLQASQGQDAEAMVDYLAHYDGSNLPLIPAVSADFSGVTAPAHNTLYTLGPMKIGSTFIDGLQGMNLSFGLNITRRVNNGELYPKSAFIKERLPRLTLTSLNHGILSDITSALNSQVSGTIVQFLRKRTTGSGGFVADATAEHVAITIAAGSWKPDSMGASGTDDGQISVGIDPTGDITVSAASAIA